MTSKEADLVTAVLLYAMRCMSEGDQHALRAMQFGPREIDALRALTLPDLYRIGTLQAHCLQIRVDGQVFWPLMQHLQSSRAAEELQQDLMQADAPLDMMRSLFGMGSREYTRSRRLLTAAPSVGRTPEPDEATAARLWQALAPYLQDADEDGLTAAEYLAVHRDTAVPIRIIWNTVQRWLEHGDVHAAPVPGEARRVPPTPQRAAG